MASTTANIHLLVLIHGMWGNPTHLAEMQRVYAETRGVSNPDADAGPDGEQLHIIVPETNKEGQTYDGIDWGGERVASEIEEEVKRLKEDGKTVTRFSITGYSLGGLVARYLVGVLHQRNFFDTVRPVNFTTVATPHIGIVRYPGFLPTMAAWLGPRLLSRTGEQFFATDKWSATGRPLLEVMADPERIFYQALCEFPHIRFYANAVNDLTVPYLTGAIETEDIYQNHVQQGMQVTFKEGYEPMLESFTIPDVPPVIPEVQTFSREWWGSLLPPLPPFIPQHFPYNILVLASSPILLPTLLGLIVYRLNKDSRSSRARIRLLENDDTYENALAKVFVNLERRIEDAALDIMEDPGSGLNTPEQEGASSPELVSASASSSPNLSVESPGVATPMSDTETMLKAGGIKIKTTSTPATTTGSETTLATSASASDLEHEHGHDHLDDDASSVSSSSSRKGRKLRDRIKACREKSKAKHQARSASVPPSTKSSSHSSHSTHSSHKSHAKHQPHAKKEAPKPEPSPLQRRIVEHLNALPNLQKHLAFIDPTMNSHAVIVVRDPEKFKAHEKGLGVLRHLADGFVM